MQPSSRGGVFPLSAYDIFCPPREGEGYPIGELCFYSLGHTLSEECLNCCRSADHSPNKIILTEQKLEERKRWVNYDL